MTELQAIESAGDVLEHVIWMLAVFMLAAGHWRAHLGSEPGRFWMGSLLALIVVGSAPSALLAPDGDAQNLDWVWRIPAIAVALTPWAMYRYARSITETSFPAGRIADVLAVVGVGWLLFMPTFPGVNFEPRPWWFALVPIIGLVTWAAAISAAARHVVLATRHRTRIERQRGRLLILAITLFAVAYLVWVSIPHPVVTIASNAALVATVLLLFGLHRRPRHLVLMLSPGTTARTLAAYELLVSEADAYEVLDEVLSLLSDAMGLVGIVILDRDGSVVAVTGGCDIHRGAPRHFGRVHASSRRLRLQGWATPFAPPLSPTDYEAMQGLVRLVEQALVRGTVTRRERDAARRLIAANERLREADELKDNFVSFVSHELRTPLAAITGYTELALAPAKAAGMKQVVDYLGVVLDQGERLEELVNDLLLLSRLDQGAIELQLAYVGIGEVVERAVTATATQDLVKLELDGPGRLRTDPLRLEQVIANLLVNARKYGEPPIIVKSEAHGDDAMRLWVIDHGSGVPETLRPRLFERFTQAGPTRETAGSGLGLAIVRLLAHALGGEAGYEHRKAAGAAFWVELPIDGDGAASGGGIVDLEPSFS